MTNQPTRPNDSPEPIPPSEKGPPAPQPSETLALSGEVIPPRRPTTPAEERALGIAALVAVATIIWVAHEVGIGILLGTLTAFTLQPFYHRLRMRWKRPALAALVCSGLMTLVCTASLSGIGYLIFGRGIKLVGNLVVALQPGGPARGFVDRISGYVDRVGLRSDIAQRIGDAAAEMSVRMAAIATVIAGATFSMLLGMFFLVITTYFVLQNWSRFSRRAEIALPLNPTDTHALFDEFRRVGRSILLGTVLTGLGQGLLAGIGYLVTGVPEPAFFGALTAVASLLPGVGTVLVWVPVGIYLILTGHAAMGIVELLYGLGVVVGFSDYVLRPWLVGRDAEIPALLMFAALFGGIETFGLIGLILGPLLMSLSVALIRIYERERETSRRTAPPLPAQR